MHWKTKIIFQLVYKWEKYWFSHTYIWPIKFICIHVATILRHVTLLGILYDNALYGKKKKNDHQFLSLKIKYNVTKRHFIFIKRLAKGNNLIFRLNLRSYYSPFQYMAIRCGSKTFYMMKNWCLAWCCGARETNHY